MASFCDERCTNATGSSCDCECGGANHGGLVPAVGGVMQDDGIVDGLSAIDRSGRDRPLTLSDKEIRDEIRALQKQTARLKDFDDKAEKDKEATSIEKRYSELLAEQKRREMGGAHIGSISHGTMRARDLIPEFRDVLADLNQKSYREHLAKYSDTPIADNEVETDDQDEERADALDDLVDRLSAEAPDGAYFGSHPGDGADYGFWLED